MQSDYLIIILAVATLGIIVAAAIWQRGRVAAKKGATERSAFTETHGGPPRPNRPGTEH